MIHSMLAGGMRAHCARALSLTVLAISLGAAGGGVMAQDADSPRDKITHSDSGDAAVVEATLFTAIEAGQVSVRVIPSDSRRLTLIVTNETERPVRLAMPAALAATPVLAQFNGGIPGFGNGNNLGAGQRNSAPQALGFPGGQNQNGINGFGNFNGGGNGPRNFNGFFNVGPGKTIKQRLPCVCLEHGKPNPSPRVEYALRPLHEVCEVPEVAAIVGTLADPRQIQRVVQLAAWRHANGMSWQELAGLRTTYVNGLSEPQFTAEEVRTAQALDRRVQRHPDPSPPSTSLTPQVFTATGSPTLSPETDVTR